MYQNTCGLTPLPEVDVNPLQDFVYGNEFSPVSSPEPIYIKQEEECDFSKMLPAFSILFGRDFGYEEACRIASSKSEDFVVNCDEDPKSFTNLTVARREPHQSCVTAPVWISPDMHREAPTEEAPVFWNASTNFSAVCESPKSAPAALVSWEASPNSPSVFDSQKSAPVWKAATQVSREASPNSSLECESPKSALASKAASPVSWEACPNSSSVCDSPKSAPVWKAATQVSREASPNSSLECDSPKSAPVSKSTVRETPTGGAARSATPRTAKRGEKRRASSEARKDSPPKWKRDVSPIGSSSPSPDTTTATAPPQRRHPSGCSSPRRDKTEVAQNSDRIRCNMRERVRTKIVNDAFTTLRDTIPLPRESKSTKLQTLRAATHYIEFLHEVYAASAYELIHGEVPKDTKCGVRYALSGFKRKSMRAVFLGNSEVLSCAFNLWVRENKLDETPLRRTISYDDTNQSSVSSPTTTYPSSTISSSLSSPMMSSAASPPPTVSPSPTTSSAQQSNPQRGPCPWTWDY